MLRGIVFILVGLWLIIAFSGCASSCLHRGLAMQPDCSPGCTCRSGVTDHAQDCPLSDDVSEEDPSATVADSAASSGSTCLLSSWQTGCNSCQQGLVSPEPCVNYLNHPRFFPVPTRPVFSPRDDAFLDDPQSIVPEPEVIGAPAGEDQSTEPTPDAPKLKVVPAPPAPPVSHEPQSAVPSRLDAVAASDWIFNPPTPSSTPQKAPVRTPQTTASNRVVKLKR